MVFCRNPNLGTHGLSHHTLTRWPESALYNVRCGMDEFPIESHFVGERINFNQKCATGKYIIKYNFLISQNIC